MQDKDKNKAYRVTRSSRSKRKGQPEVDDTQPKKRGPSKKNVDKGKAVEERQPKSTHRDVTSSREGSNVSRAVTAKEQSSSVSSGTVITRRTSKRAETTSEGLVPETMVLWKTHDVSEEADEEDFDQVKGLHILRTREMKQFGSRHGPAQVNQISSPHSPPGQGAEGEEDDIMSELDEIDFDVAPEGYLMPESAAAVPLQVSFVQRITPEEYQRHATTKSELYKLVQYLSQRNREMGEALSQMTGSMLNVTNMWALFLVLVVAVMLALYRPYCADMPPSSMAELPQGATLGNRMVHYWKTATYRLPCVPCPHGLKCSRLSVIGCQDSTKQLKDKEVCVHLGAKGDQVWAMSKLVQYSLERKAWMYNCMGSGTSAHITTFDLTELMKSSSDVPREEFDQIFDEAIELMETHSQTFNIAYHKKSVSYSSYKFETALSCWSGMEYAKDHFLDWFRPHGGTATQQEQTRNEL